MATVKVSELSGKALDYAVAMCEGYSIEKSATMYWLTKTDGENIPLNRYNPSQDWAIAGPIIDKYGIEINSRLKRACMPEYFPDSGIEFDEFVYLGDTVLTAAMRCYVRFKMGESVEIPDNLL